MSRPLTLLAYVPPAPTGASVRIVNVDASKRLLEQTLREARFTTHQAIRTAGAGAALGIDVVELQQRVAELSTTLQTLIPEWVGWP